nr:PREDICTED: lipoxygenase homology domain-containing protein 1-like [Anolis carolinensis]|eukprot:XP_016847361.1 PREDICTED: lipoxygenase homology domain-containing protein 1-like [Anolis carolinensis]
MGELERQHKLFNCLVSDSFSSVLLLYHKRGLFSFSYYFFSFHLFWEEYPWSLWIWTSDIKGAGTDAPIFLQIYGDKGKSDEMKLDNKSDNFEAGQTDKFMIELPDFGILYKIRIWHEKRSPFAGWHLDKVRSQ